MKKMIWGTGFTPEEAEKDLQDMINMANPITILERVPTYRCWCSYVALAYYNE